VIVDAVLGTWSFSGIVPAGTTMVSFELKPSVGESGVVQTFVLPADGSDAVVTFDYDLAAKQITFYDRMHSGPSCVAPTLIVGYEVWSFVTEPLDKSGDPSTWAGAVPAGVFTSVPDLTTRSVLQSLHLPPDATYMYVVLRPSALHTAGPWISATSFGSAVEPYTGSGLSTTFEFACP